MPRRTLRAWQRPSTATLRLLLLRWLVQRQREAPRLLLLRLWHKPLSATQTLLQVRLHVTARSFNCAACSL
jgi:hypothetical protein